MCGLSGWFSSDKINKDKGSVQIERMVKSISHRGPDGEGVLLKENAALGHVRLAIIDLETGIQPMSLKSKDIHIVFNGEIFNYKELKEGLEKDRFVFKTNSDTEVILAMYVKWGLDAFQYLRGMFALVIWDEGIKRGFLVRDENGIKPLFYKNTSNNDLVFSSEAKGILAKDNRAADIDLNSMHFLLNFRYIPNEKTMFKDIKQVEPGEIIEWSCNKSIKKHKFKYLNTESHNNLLSSLKESVRLHLTADVEVGTYLSGGIDSASVSKLANEFTDNKLRTFTLNTGDDPNEAKNAQNTAALLGFQNTLGEAAEDVEAILPRLVWHLEVPKVNAFQTYEVAKLASSQVKVVMSGLGGDELFYGYNAHRIMLLAERANQFIPKSISRVMSDSFLPIIKKMNLPMWSEHERALQMFGNLGDWSRVYGLLRNVWDNQAMREKIYGSRLLDEGLPDAYNYLESVWPNEKDPVEALAEYEWRHKMVNDLLWQEDRCSMAVGLEVRVPFLDPVFSQQVKNIARQELMKGGQPKSYMRNMLKDILPEQILKRPKSGFQVDAADFFHKNLSELSDVYLSRNKIIEYGLFNPDFVSEVLNYQVGKNVRWHYFMLYMMIMSHIWLEIFEKQNLSFQFQNVN